MNKKLMYNKFTTAEKAVELVKSGDNVLVHGAAATPQTLLKALTNRAHSLKDVGFYQIHTEGFADYANAEYEDVFSTNCFFIGHNMREAVASGRAQYIPVFLSDIPYLIRREIIGVDVVLVNVSPPDLHGYCSLGVTVCEVVAAIEKARTVIAQINPNMPRTHGDGLVHVRNFSAMVDVDDPVYAVDVKDPGPNEMKIGRYIAEMVADGSCLQMGIGGIPNAALKAMTNHKDLGIHTEMFSDGIIDLVEKGVINNRLKPKHPHKIVSSFAIGSNALYEFMNDNPEVNMLDCSYTNDTHVIRNFPKMVAINSAIEVDLTGQVCADSIGSRMYSGVGGQMDFIRGAALSPGGKPIIALESATRKGISKIVPSLKPGAGVVTTRAHVHYVVTENGVADLFGKNLKQRAKALIEISHPDHQEQLDREAHALYG